MKIVKYKDWTITAYRHILYPPFPNYIAVARKDVKATKKCPIKFEYVAISLGRKSIGFNVEADSLQDVINLAKDEIDSQRLTKWGDLL